MKTAYLFLVYLLAYSVFVQAVDDNPEECDASLSPRVCPRGSYCPRTSTQPILCPAGSYGNITGLDLCLPTPPGYYTPEEGAVTPSECPAGTYCPLDSTSVPTPCPASYYCPLGSIVPVICPGGHYCPLSSAFPVPCPSGSVIRSETAADGRVSLEAFCNLCPAGTYVDSPGQLTCLPCTRGYVCLGGTSHRYPTLPAHNGYLCPAGHYCPEGSGVGLPCPAGSSNPRVGQYSPSVCLPCPVGTYGSLEGLAGCRPCPASAVSIGAHNSSVYSYVNVPNSSDTTGGAPTTPVAVGALGCTCLGRERYFHSSDGQCVCRPGFAAPAIRDAAEQPELEPQSDGTSDCQPIALDRCGGGAHRLASGACAPVDCSTRTQCSSGSGHFNTVTGRCDCDGLLPAAEICGEACERTRIRMFIRNNARDINLIARRFVDPDDEVEDVAQLAILRGDEAGSTAIPANLDAGADVQEQETTVLSAADCSSSNGATECEVFSVEVGPAGMFAVFNTSETLLNWMGMSDEYNSASRLLSSGKTQVTNIQGRSPRLDSIDENGVYLIPSSPAILRPVLCLQAGESVVFTLHNLSSYNARLGLDTSSGAPSFAYPVYVKDSLLNTNPAFDYGAFRRLQTLATVDPLLASSSSGSSSVGSKWILPSYFIFTFRINGTYLFASSIDPAMETLVVVMPPGQACPSGASKRLLPPTYESFAVLGVHKSQPQALAPNWSLLGGLAGGLAVAGAGLGLLLHVLRAAAMRDGSWRSLLGRRRSHGENLKESALISSASSVDADAIGSLFGDPASRLTPQDLDTAALVQRVRQHEAEMAAALETQRQVTADIAVLVKAESRGIRGLLVDAAGAARANALMDEPSAGESVGKEKAVEAQEAADAARLSSQLAILSQEVAARAQHSELRARLAESVEEEAKAVSREWALVCDSSPSEIVSLAHSSTSSSSDSLNRSLQAFLVAADALGRAEAAEIARRRHSPLEWSVEAALHANSTYVVDSSTKDTTAGKRSPFAEEFAQLSEPLGKEMIALAAADALLLSAGSSLVSNAARAAARARNYFNNISGVPMGLSVSSEYASEGVSNPSKSSKSLKLLKNKENVSPFQLVDLSTSPALIYDVPGTEHPAAVISALQSRSAFSLPPVPSENLRGMKNKVLPLIGTLRALAEARARRGRASKNAATGAIAALKALLTALQGGSYDGLNLASIPPSILKEASKNFRDAHFGATSTSADIDDHSNVGSSESGIVIEGSGEAALASVVVSAAQSTATAAEDNLVQAFHATVVTPASISEQKQVEEKRASILNDPNLTDAERKRLLAEFEAQQRALAEALEKEKERQAAELERRVRQRREAQLKRGLRRAEELRVQEGLQREQRDNEVRMRLEAEERARILAVDSSELAMITGENDSASSVGQSPTELDPVAQAALLRAQFEADQAALAAAAERGRARARADLEARLRGRGQARVRQLRQQQQKELAVLLGKNGEIDGEERQLLLDRHKEQLEDLKDDLEELAAEALQQHESAVAAASASASDAARRAHEDAAEGLRRLISSVKANMQAELRTLDEALEAETDPARRADLMKQRAHVEERAEREIQALTQALDALDASFAAGNIQQEVSRLGQEAELRLLAEQASLESSQELRRSERLQALVAKDGAALSSYLAANDNNIDAGEGELLLQRAQGSAEAALVELKKKEQEEEEALRARAAETAEDLRARVRSLRAEFDAAQDARAEALQAEKLRQRQALEERARNRRVRARKLLGAALSESELAQLEPAVDDSTSQELAQVMEAALQEQQVMLSQLDTILPELISSEIIDSTLMNSSDSSENGLKDDDSAFAAMHALQLRSLVEGRDAEAAEAAAEELLLLQEEEALEREKRRNQMRAEQAKAKDLLAQQQRESLLDEAARVRAEFVDCAAAVAASVDGERARLRAVQESRLIARKEMRLRRIQFSANSQVSTAAPVTSSTSVHSTLANEAVEDVNPASVAVDSELAALKLQAEQEAALAIAKEAQRLLLAEASASAAEDARLRAAAEASLARVQQLQQRQRLEREAAEAAAAEEQVRLEQEQREREQRQAERMREELQERQRRADAAAAAASNADEAARIRAEFTENAEKYQESLRLEREKQAERTKASLANRRARAARELARKQEREQADEEERAAEELRVVNSAIALERESKVLQSIAQSTNAVVTSSVVPAAGSTPASSNSIPSSAASTINKVVVQDTSAATEAALVEAIEVLIPQRHATELGALLAEHARSRERALTSLLESLADRKAEAVASLMESLEASGDSVDSPLAQASLAEISARFARERTREEQALEDRQSLAQARAEAVLRARQAKELASTLALLAPSAQQARAEANRAAREAERAAARQQRALEAQEAAAALAAEEARRAEEEVEQRAQQEIGRIEAEHQQRMARAREKAAAELEERKQKMLAEAEELNRRAQEENKGLDEEARIRLVKQFEDEKARISERVEKARSQQGQRLQDKLEERKNRMLAKARREHEEQLQKEKEAAAQKAREEERRKRLLLVPEAAPTAVSLLAGTGSGLLEKVSQAQQKLQSQNDNVRLAGAIAAAAAARHGPSNVLSSNALADNDSRVTRLIEGLEGIEKRLHDSIHSSIGKETENDKDKEKDKASEIKEHLPVFQNLSEPLTSSEQESFTLLQELVAILSPSPSSLPNSPSTSPSIHVEIVQTIDSGSGRCPSSGRVAMGPTGLFVARSLLASGATAAGERARAVAHTLAHHFSTDPSHSCTDVKKLESLLLSRLGGAVFRSQTAFLRDPNLLNALSGESYDPRVQLQLQLPSGITSPSSSLQLQSPSAAHGRSVSGVSTGSAGSSGIASGGLDVGVDELMDQSLFGRASRITSLEPTGSRAFVAAYIRELEERQLAAEEVNSELQSADGANSIENSLDGGLNAIGRELASLSSAGASDAARQRLLMDHRDRAEKVFLSKAKAHSEALVLVSTLEAEKESLLERLTRAQRAERRRARLVNGPIAESESDLSTDSESDSEDGSFYPADRVAADIRRIEAELVEARARADAAKIALDETAKRVETIAQQIAAMNT